MFALPGEPGLTELSGDFKVHFHDRQGDFYWLHSVSLVIYVLLCGFLCLELSNRTYFVQLVKHNVYGEQKDPQHQRS